MNKKIEDAAKKYIETGRGFDMDSLSDTIKKVIFKDGAEWALRDVIETLDDWADHYAIDIFPNSVKLTDNSSRDSVSAHVSRHILNCVKQDIQQLLSSEGENNGL